MKHEIEIEGLPEGWEPVAFRKPKEDEYIFCNDTGRVAHSIQRIPAIRLIVKKKQPRRIVLEETDEDNIKHNNSWCSQHFTRGLILTQQPKRWREIKETDLSLHNADDKESLRLTREQCRELLQFSSSAIEMIKDFLRSKS